MWATNTKSQGSGQWCKARMLAWGRYRAERTESWEPQSRGVYAGSGRFRKVVGDTPVSDSGAKEEEATLAG